MKKIHILSTDKPSRLGYIFESESYHIFTNGENPNDIKDNLAHPMNIYITSDEEIKEGDWCYHPLLKWGSVIKSKYDKPNSTMKKILLTTDPDLIADGIEQISEDTLLKIVEHINSGKKIKSFNEL